jgi:hypothetical protein
MTPRGEAAGWAVVLVVEHHEPAGDVEDPAAVTRPVPGTHPRAPRTHDVLRGLRSCPKTDSR